MSGNSKEPQENPPHSETPREINNENASRKEAEIERDRIFNFSLDMLCIVGFDGYFKELNPAFEKTLGWSDAELKARPFLEFVHPQDREITARVFKELFDGKKILGFENRYLTRSGAYLWVSWNSFPLVDEKLVFAVARDISRQKEIEYMLIQSIHKYRDTLDGINFIAVQIDNDGVITFCNDFLIKLTGWLRKELVGRNWFDIFIPAGRREELKRLHRSILKSGQNIPGGSVNHSYENEILTRSGEVRVVSWSNIPLTDTEGNVIGVSSFGQDITDEKIAQDKIAREVHKFKVLYDLGVKMSAAKSLDENLQYIIEKSCELLEADSSSIALCGENPGSITCRLSVGGKTEALSHFIVPYGQGLGGNVLKEKRGIISKDYHTEYKTSINDLIVAQEGFVSLMAAPLMSKDTPLGVLYVANRKKTEFTQDDLDTLTLLANLAAVEITRKDREDALLMKMEFERLVSLISTDFINLPAEDFNNVLRQSLQATGEFLQADNVFLYLEYPESGKKSLSINWYDRVKEAQLRPLEGFYSEFKAWGKPRIAKDRYIIVSGINDISEEAKIVKEAYKNAGVKSLLVVPFLFSGVPVGVMGIISTVFEDKWGQEEVGQLNFIVEILANLLKRKEAEDAIKQSELKLKEAYRELKEAQEQLIQTEKMVAMGQMAAGISHELNQPLTGIKGFAQAALLDIDPDNPIRQDLIKIVEQSDRMDKIIKNIRFFARKSDFQMEEINVNQPIEASFMLLNEQLKLYNIEVRKSLAVDLPRVLGDSNQLQQVFLNLITNARDALEAVNKSEGKEISAESSFDPRINKIVIKIKDNGVGIPEQKLEHIFNPFYTTKGPDKGMGLGLSIVYRIIENHKGQIEVSSQVGSGTLFTITLPAAADS